MFSVLLDNLIAILTNPVLLCAAFAWFLAQFCKLFTSSKYRNGISLLRFAFGSGGMPSSHAAAVCATCFSCGILYGYGSAAFAVSGVLAAVVMKDASGIRREAGKQAEVINQITGELNKKSRRQQFEDTLKVLLGHTPLQVLVGAILGFIVAFVSQYIVLPAIFSTHPFAVL